MSIPNETGSMDCGRYVSQPMPFLLPSRPCGSASATLCRTANGVRRCVWDQCHGFGSAFLSGWTRAVVGGTL